MPTTKRGRGRPCKPRPLLTQFPLETSEPQPKRGPGRPRTKRCLTPPPFNTALQPQTKRTRIPYVLML